MRAKIGFGASDATAATRSLSPLRLWSTAGFQAVVVFANKRREAWADGMVDKHHAKFYACGYPYIVSDVGEIFGPSGKLAQPKDRKGYARFKQKSVHRLVALNFVPGYFEGAEVDHINAVRDDNRKENLRWVTPEQNKAYARESIIAANKARAKSNAVMQANQR